MGVLEGRRGYRGRPFGFWGADLHSWERLASEEKSGLIARIWRLANHYPRETSPQPRKRRLFRIRTTANDPEDRRERARRRVFPYSGELRGGGQGAPGGGALRRFYQKGLWCRPGRDVYAGVPSAKLRHR